MHTLKARAKGISLGLFAADMGNLRAEATQAAGWGCEILHYDVMDGVFVPGMTAGPGVVAATDAGMLRDVHLMVENPGAHVASYVRAGADMITVHAESRGAGEALTGIRKAADAAGRPVLAGFALMPGTSLGDVQGLLNMAPDMMLVLSLDPRQNAAPDITSTCTRVKELRRQFGQACPVLAFDGGVTLDTIDEIAACGPDMIVSGSAVLGAPDPKSAFEVMARACPTQVAI